MDKKSTDYDYHKLLRKVLKKIPFPYNMQETDNSIIVTYTNGTIEVYKTPQG